MNSYGAFALPIYFNSIPFSHLVRAADPEQHAAHLEARALELRGDGVELGVRRLGVRRRARRRLLGVDALADVRPLVVERAAEEGALRLRVARLGARGGGGGGAGRVGR